MAGSVDVSLKSFNFSFFFKHQRLRTSFSVEKTCLRSVLPRPDLACINPEAWMRASWKASKFVVSVGIGVPTICGKRKSTPSPSNLQPSLSWSHEQGPSLFSNFLAVPGHPLFYTVGFNPEASEQDRPINRCPETCGAEFCSKSFICHDLKSLSRFQSAPFSNVQSLEGYTV